MKKKLFLFALCSLLCANIPISVSADLDMDSIESEAEENAKNAVEVTDGALYDLISSFCQGAVIMDHQDNSFSVDFTDIVLPEDTIIETYAIPLSARIIGAGAMDYCDSITFASVSDSTLFTLIISDFISFDDFQSTFMCFNRTDDASQAAAAKILYEGVFYNFDTLTKNSREQNNIIEKYGGEPQELKDVKNDLWWAYSSFDIYNFNTTVSFNNDAKKAIINYKNTSNTYEDGYKVWNDVLRSIARFDQLYESENGKLSFYVIDVICFTESTDNRLFELQLEKKLDGAWETTVANYYGDEFKNGVNAANEAAQQ